MSTTITGVHPFADRFPMLPEDELVRLAEDIAENGLQNPVVLDAQGRILDGRNRDAACQRLGITPEVVVYDGDDAASFVLSQNVTRRHLTTGQQAMSTALVLVDAGRRESGRWKRGSVVGGNGDSSTTAWIKSLTQAGAVLDYAPDLAPAVVAGDLALDAAHRQAEQRRDAERQRLEREERVAAEEADAKAFVESTAPDLAALVGSTLQSFSEARAVWEKRNREEAARLAAEKKAAEKEAADELRARTDLYTGIARNVIDLATYGRYPSVDDLMAEYMPHELRTPRDADGFAVDTLTVARDFLNGLIDWSKK